MWSTHTLTHTGTCKKIRPMPPLHTHIHTGVLFSSASHEGWRTCKKMLAPLPLSKSILSKLRLPKSLPHWPKTSRSLRNDAALLSIFQRMENWVPTTKAKPSPCLVRFPLDLRRVLPTRANTEVVTKQNCSTTIGVAVRNFQKPKRKNNNNFRRKLQCAWRMRDKENLSFYKYAIKKKKYIYKDIRAVWLTSADSNDRVKRRVVPK